MQYKRCLSVLIIMSMIFSILTPLGSMTVTAANDPALKGTIPASSANKLTNMMENFATQFVVVKHKQLSGSNNAYTQANTDDRNTGQTHGNAYQWDPGSEMVLLTLVKNASGGVDRYEKVLVSSPNGVLRDPDVSSDGSTLLFSWKKDTNDDYHLYLLDLTDENAQPKQITFGAGITDTEGRFAPNGKIIFSSSRCVQNVDCWIITVMNLYTCDYDPVTKTVSKITRLGQDQVHTTYPTITSDGRVIYTRWDYNDRTQLYTQPVFQMFPDGTNQTELYGNNTNFPTSMVQTVEIPGVPNKYFSIATGHHTGQVGKLVKIDTNIDRNDMENTKGKITDENNKRAVSFVDKNNGLPANYWDYNIDDFGGNPKLYKYPVAINEQELICSYSTSGDGRNRTAPYGINYLNINPDNSVDYVLLCGPSTIGGATVGASQTSPIRTSALKMNTLQSFSRPSMVNYKNDRGTYYIGNVYEGEAVKGLTRPVFNEEGELLESGEVKSLRVVKLDYRTASIGDIPQNGELPTGQTYNGVSNDGGTSDMYTPIAVGRGSWDVKQILGVATVEEDGSALFTIPARVPVYFQLLNEDGEVLQTMRSWSTLMPGETFSCVGCHENKNSTPPAESVTTMAMKRGVEDLQPESWMNDSGDIYEDYDPYKDDAIGFSYLKEIQPIFDKNCVSCHNNTQETFDKIGYTAGASEEILIDSRAVWDYKTTQAGTYDKSAHAPFGTSDTNKAQSGDAINTEVNDNSIWMQNSFNVNQYQLDTFHIVARIMSAGDVEVKLNGKLQSKPQNFSPNSQGYVDFQLSDVKVGENTIEIKSVKANNRLKLDAKIVASNVASENNKVLIPTHSGGWKYKVNNVTGTDWKEVNFDDSGWTTNPIGEAFGNNSSSPATTQPNTPITDGNNPPANTKLYVRKQFNLAREDFTNGVFNKLMYLNMAYDQNPEVYINGTLVFSTTGVQDKAYDKINITDNVRTILNEGSNTLAIYIINTGGGMCFDAGITTAVSDGTLIATKSGEWRYKVNGGSDMSWTQKDYNDSAWLINPKGQSFGNNATSPSLTQPNTPITDGKEPPSGTTLFARKKFNLSANDFTSGKFNKLLYLNIAYDQNPQVYINGKLVFTITAFQDKAYDKINITKAADDVLQQGENTLAVYVINTGGGMCFDAGLSVEEGGLSDAPFSLAGTTYADANIGKRMWPASYLLLTGATVQNVLGNPYNTNPYIMWTSCMSGAAMQPAKSTGSLTSPMIEFLKSNPDHKNLISESELKRICAWIDLAVPLCGTYDENANWPANAWREFHERQNKRAFYKRLDDYSVALRAGKVFPDGNIEISYSSGGTEIASTSGTGLVEFNVPKKLAIGDVITVKLPENQKYLAFTYHPMFKESIVYCPSGRFTYVVPSVATNAFPQFITPGHTNQNISLTMTARIPTEDELQKEHNLSMNALDVTDGASAYPHATVSTIYQDPAKPRPARNVVDGYTINIGGHTNYPQQSWLPADDTFNNWFKVDFGRVVKVNRLVVYLRADFPHDDWFTKTTLRFSDGTTTDALLYKTEKGIEINLSEPVETSFVSLSDLKTAQGGWASLSEVEIYGTESENQPAVTPTQSLNKTEPTTTWLKIGESINLSNLVSALPAEANQTFAWSSSNSKALTVGLDGIVQAVGAGTADIYATALDNNSKTVKFTLTAGIKISSLTLTPVTHTTGKIGDTFRIEPKILPANASNKVLTWSVDNPAVATVSEDGTVTLKGYGTAKVTASATDDSGKSAQCSITVTEQKPPIIRVQNVAVSGVESTLEVSKTMKLTAKISPDNAANKAVSWKTTTPSVVSVDKNGLVKGLKYGTAKITATADGKSTTVTFKVKSKVSKITFKKNTVSVKRSKTSNLTKLFKTITPPSAYRINTKYTWKSSDKKLVSVNSKGVVKVAKKAKKNKKITIYVYNGKKRIGSIKVQVK